MRRRALCRDERRRRRRNRRRVLLLRLLDDDRDLVLGDLAAKDVDEFLLVPLEEHLFDLRGRFSIRPGGVVIVTLLRHERRRERRKSRGRLTSSPTSPWIKISSSPCGVLLTVAPAPNLFANSFAAFFMSTPKWCRPCTDVTYFFLLRSMRFTTTLADCGRTGRSAGRQTIRKPAVVP